MRLAGQPFPHGAVWPAGFEPAVSGTRNRRGGLLPHSQMKNPRRDSNPRFRTENPASLPLDHGGVDGSVVSLPVATGRRGITPAARLGRVPLADGWGFTRFSPFFALPRRSAGVLSLGPRRTDRRRDEHRRPWSRTRPCSLSASRAAPRTLASESSGGRDRTCASRLTVARLAARPHRNGESGRRGSRTPNGREAAPVFETGYRANGSPSGWPRQGSNLHRAD